MVCNGVLQSLGAWKSNTSDLSHLGAFSKMDLAISPPRQARTERRVSLNCAISAYVNKMDSRSTYAMGRLTAALQPNTSIVADCPVLKVDPVVSANCPLRIFQVTTRHEVSGVLEQGLVQISEIPGGNEHGVDIEGLLLLTCAWYFAEI